MIFDQIARGQLFFAVKNVMGGSAGIGMNPFLGLNTRAKDASSPRDHEKRPPEHQNFFEILTKIARGQLFFDRLDQLFF